MAKITYNNKTDLITQPVPNENKVTASDMNEIKASVNQNVDDIALKADLNGNSLQVFEVADGTIPSHSINKGQLDSAISNLQGALIPQDNWDANTNTPDISITTQTGYYWIVNVSGNTNLDGITDWEVNDWAVKTATGWAKIDNTDKVLSVAGKTGVITLNHNDITDFDAEVSSIISTDVDKAFVDALGINATQLNGQNASFYQNASNINSGTLADARLSSNVALENVANTFLVPQFITAKTPSNNHGLFVDRTPNSGFSNIFSTTDLAENSDSFHYNARSNGVIVFNVNHFGDIFSKRNISANGVISGNGSGLTNLNATNISTGTLADARLSSNVALLDATQTFTGLNIFNNIQTFGILNAEDIDVSGQLLSDTISSFRTNTNLVLYGRDTGIVEVNDDLQVNGSIVKQGATANDILLGDGTTRLVSTFVDTTTDQLNISGFKTFTGSVTFRNNNTNTLNLLGDDNISPSINFNSTNIGIVNDGNLSYNVISEEFNLDKKLNVVGGVSVYEIKLTQPTTFANLPSAASSQDVIRVITDASSITYRGAASGGGSERAIVYSNGTNWIYH